MPIPIIGYAKVSYLAFDTAPSGSAAPLTDVKVSGLALNRTADAPLLPPAYLVSTAPWIFKL